MELNSWNPVLDTMEKTVDAYVEFTSRLNANETETPLTGSRQPDLIPSEEGLVHIDSKLARLVSIEQRLKASRVRLQSIRNTSVTLAPINRLPVDILSMIVVAGHEADRMQKGKRETEAADSELFNPPSTDDSEDDFEDDSEDDSDNDSDDDSDDTDVQHFPTTFSHVCRRWRDIAINTASVWSDITFGPPHPNEIGADWIKRSKQSDLTVDFFTMDEDDTADFQQGLKTLGPNVLRATSVVLDMFNKENLLEGLKHLTMYGRPPPLKRLKLLVPTTVGILTSENFGEARWEVLMDMAKGLEYLHTSNVFFPLGGPAYQGLKRLQLAHVKEPIAPGNDIGLLAIFQNSPELECLTLVDVEVALWGNEIPPLGSRVQLQKLQTFSAHRLSIRLICFTLSVLCAPALERLSVSDYIPESGRSEIKDSGLTDTLLDFVKNLRPASLKHLGLRGIQLASLDIPFDQVLARTPNLESLYIGEKGECSRTVGEGILKGMLGPEHLAPKLNRLGLRGCNFPPLLLKELVIQRSGLDGMLPIRYLLVERCCLRSQRFPSEVVLPVLQEKVEEVVWKHNIRTVPMFGSDVEY